MADSLKSSEAASSADAPSVSKKTYSIAGIVTTVFGLDELSPQASEVACLWLLNPRLATQERMAPFAIAAITDWNNRVQDGRAQSPAKGLIAITFDQRNHGTRIIDPIANEAWRQGNPRHAQDMFSIFRELQHMHIYPSTLMLPNVRVLINCNVQYADGTSRDVSDLIDYLPSYIFPKSERKISDHLVLGVSLGGHATWHCVLHDPRINTAIPIIGCPDYISLMADRARLSKLPSWTSSDPEGSQFLGSEAFPHSLVEAVRKYDPAGLFLSHVDLGTASGPLENGPLPEPTEEEKKTLRPLLTHCLAGKRILNLSGGLDKLVPYHRGASFLSWLKKAVAPGGWFGDGAVVFEDVIDENAGHEVTPKMMLEAVRFISESIDAANGSPRKSGFVRESKI